MRRLALVFVIVLGMVCASSPVQAAGSPSALLSAIQRSVPSGRAVPAGHLAPVPVAAADQRANQQATALALAASVFAPATINQQYSGVLSSSVADQNWFAANHSTSYTNLHFVTGYFVEADWQPSGASQQVNFFYQGSIFDNTSDAIAAWTDGVTFTQSTAGVTSSDCSSIVGMQCALLTYSTTSNAQVQYTALQFDQCTAEVADNVPGSIASSVETQTASTLANIDVAAASALKSACGNQPPPPTSTPAPPPPTKTSTPIPPPPTTTPTPPPATTQFSLISVRVEKNGAQPDWNQVRAPLRQVKTGAKVQLAIYFIVRSGPAGEPYTVHWTVTKGGQKVLDQDFSKDHLSDSKPADTYWDAVGPLQLKSKGTYHITGTLTIDGRSASGSSSITVKPKAVPPPPPVSFSFDRLVVTDAKGHPIKTMTAGSGLNIVATYTVRNVRPGQVVSGVIVRSYEIKVAGHGFQKFTGSSDSIAADNGTHRSAHFARWNQAGALRILVGITIGGSFQQRHYDIQVR